MSRTPHRALAALSVAALALTGCSVSGSSGDGASSSASGASVESTTVTIMTHDSFNLPQELVQKFEQESGYTLKLSLIHI